GVVVDFSKENLLVSDVLFNIDGTNGEILRASGDLAVNVAEFFSVSGRFAFEKSSEKLTLDDGKTVDVNALKLDGTGVSAFAGVGEQGFVLGDVDFGLALLSEKADATRRWTSLQATAGNAAFIGSQELEISGKNFAVEINTPDKSGNVIDFAKQNLTFSSAKSLKIAGKDGEISRAGGELKVNLAGFIVASGSFAIEKSTQELTLSNASKIEADLLTFGGEKLSAFAGLNGNSAAKMGFEIQEADFGFALISDKKDVSRQWVALQGQAKKVGFVGIEGFTASAKNLALNYNQADKNGVVVDFAAQPLQIATGETSTTELNLDGKKGELIQAVGDVEINVKDFFQVSGSFGFEKKTQEITLSDGSKTTADLLAVGGKNINAFAGLAGGTADEMGLKLENIDFALALLTDKTDVGRRWLTLQTNAGAAGFVGVDGVTISADNLFVQINQSIGKDSNVTVSATGQKIVQEKTNTILNLDVSQSAGKIELSYKNQTASVDLNSRFLATELQLAFEKFDGIGAGNVKISGSKTDGFKIEFVGELAGQPIENVEVNTIAPEISVEISEQKAGSTVVEKIKNGVDANEIQVLNFNGLQAGKGTFTLTFDGKTTADIIFAGSNRDGNVKNIQTALETLANIGAGNVIVTFAKDWAIDKQRYNIEFKGNLKNKNVGKLVINSEKLTISKFETQQVAKTQQILIGNVGTKATNESYTLKLNGEESAAISLSANSVTFNEAQIKAALEGFSGIGTDNVSVVFDQKSTIKNQNYIVTFKTALPLLEVGNVSKLQGENIVISAKNGSTSTIEKNISIADVKTANVSVEVVKEGTAAEFTEKTIKNSELQSLKITSTTDGTFVLSLGNAKTDELPLDVSAENLQAALNKALNAKIEVSQAKNGAFLISFADSFSGQNVELLKVETKSAVQNATLEINQLGKTTEKTVETETSKTEQITLVVD
ncbi:hypothetical protein, partial [Limnohabitans sp.]